MTTTPYQMDHYAPAAEDSDDDLASLDEAINAEKDPVEDEHDTDTDPGDDDADDAAGTGSGDKAKNAAKNTRALIRRAAAKTLEVQETPGMVRTLAATQLSCSEDVVDLVTAIMSAKAATPQVMNDIQKITDELRDEPWGVGITATAMGRNRLKSMWALLHAVGAAGSPAMPASEAKAGLAVVKAVNALTDDHRLDLLASAELLNKRN